MQPSVYSYFVLKNFRKIAEQTQHDKTNKQKLWGKVVNEGPLYSISPLSLSSLSPLGIKRIQGLSYSLQNRVEVGGVGRDETSVSSPT